MVREVQKIRAGMLKVFWRWLYKYKDHERYLRMFKMVHRFRVDFRIRMLNRRLRVYKQNKIFFRDMWDMTIKRAKFKQIIHKITFVQKTLRFFRFLNLIRFAKGIKEILWEHYNNIVWKEIDRLIRERSATTIQKWIRGDLSRRYYAEERTHIKRYHDNIYQNKAAKLIQKRYKGYIVRVKVKRMKKSAITVQRFYRGGKVRRVFKIVKNATVVIQNYWRLYSFAQYKFSEKGGKERLDPRKLFERIWEVERENIYGFNYSEDMSYKERKMRFSHKKPVSISYLDSRIISNIREREL